MMQFCGQMPFCTAFNSRRAMEEAKKNVELGFPVVGVVELWEETLEVLEHTLPFFFKGATEMYAKKKKEVYMMIIYLYMLIDECPAPKCSNLYHHLEMIRN